MAFRNTNVFNAGESLMPEPIGGALAADAQHLRPDDEPGRAAHPTKADRRERRHHFERRARPPECAHLSGLPPHRQRHRSAHDWPADLAVFVRVHSHLRAHSDRSGRPSLQLVDGRDRELPAAKAGVSRRVPGRVHEHRRLRERVQPLGLGLLRERYRSEPHHEPDRTVAGRRRFRNGHHRQLLELGADGRFAGLHCLGPSSGTRASRRTGARSSGSAPVGRTRPIRAW